MTYRIIQTRYPSLPGKAAVDFAADYLTCVHQYVMEVCLPRQFGSVFLQNQQFSYVITVPPLCKVAATALTRQAAVRAGIPEQNLTLITETEAAAWYCVAMCTEAGLHEGDCFLICDAGDITVVISRITCRLTVVGSDCLQNYTRRCTRV